MSARDNVCTRRLSAGVVLILILCACSMAVHFIVEGLTPVAGFDVAVHGGQAGLIHEHCEDNFVFFALIGPMVDQIAIPVPSPMALGLFSFSISPLLPPPNL